VRGKIKLALSSPNGGCVAWRSQVATHPQLILNGPKKAIFLQTIQRYSSQNDGGTITKR